MWKTTYTNPLLAKNNTLKLEKNYPDGEKIRVDYFSQSNTEKEKHEIWSFSHQIKYLPFEI